MWLVPEVTAVFTPVGVLEILLSVTLRLGLLLPGCVLPFKADARLRFPFGCFFGVGAPSVEGARASLVGEAPSVEALGGFKGGDVAPVWLVAWLVAVFSL